MSQTPPTVDNGRKHALPPQPIVNTDQAGIVDSTVNVSQPNTVLSPTPTCPGAAVNSVTHFSLFKGASVTSDNGDIRTHSDNTKGYIENITDGSWRHADVDANTLKVRHGCNNDPPPTTTPSGAPLPRIVNRSFEGMKIRGARVTINAFSDNKKD